MYTLRKDFIHHLKHLSFLMINTLKIRDGEDSLSWCFSLFSIAMVNTTIKKQLRGGVGTLSFQRIVHLRKTMET